MPTTPRKKVRHDKLQICSGDCGCVVSTERERAVQCEECDRWFCGSCAIKSTQTCFCLPKRALASGDGMLYIGSDGEGATLCCDCANDPMLAPAHCCSSCRRIACGTCCAACVDEVESEIWCEDCDAVCCASCSANGAPHNCSGNSGAGSDSDAESEFRVVCTLWEEGSRFRRALSIPEQREYGPSQRSLRRVQ